MTDLSKLLGELSPEQWKLLQLRLKKKQSTQGEPDKAGRIPRRDPGRQELPLSFSQQRLWFLDQWEPGNPAYNVFAAFRLEGTLDPAALARAIEEIVRRHESLRTTFTSEAGRPRQVVSAPGPVPMPLVDLAGLPSRQAAGEVRRLGAAHAGRSFDLERGPMLRGTLVRLAPAEHWALLCVHHIVSDGWSMGVFNRELAVLYTAFRQGASSPLPPLAIQYPDYALWQREWLAGETLEGQLAFWRELLSGAPPMLDLPLDHPRGALPGAPAGYVTLRMPRDISDRLQALAVAEGSTLYMVLLAGFTALLARYTGNDDVVVGAPVANRNRSDIEGLIGFFVNTLAVRVSAAGDPTGRELLRRARKVTSGAYDHQDVPFELLVDELQPERDLSHPPLVQVTLGLQNLPPQSAELPGLRLSVVPLESAAAKFDMVWSLVETPEGINGGVEFNLNLFEMATAARMTGHFAGLLEAFAEHPDARLSDLPLLTATERHQLLVAWNDTATAFPRERTVAELFEEQAAAAPEATAVVFRDQSLTYGELDERAGRLARRLRRLGVGPEVPVGLCADRSLDLIVGLLAIVKAGGAFVPLDPAYPSERLGYMLESSGAPLVLAQARTVSSLPEDVQARVLLLEEIQGEDLEEDLPAPRPLPENLLYIIYTSGSTGKPKGVAVSHRSAIRLVRDVDYARLDASETFLQIVPLSFDPSMFEIWGSLLNGARLVLFPTRVPTLEEIEETVRDKGVTTLWLTTGLFHQVVDHKIEALYPLRQLLAGGEALSLPHVRKVLEQLPGVRMVNGYGPTEVTCFTTTWTAGPLPADATGVPIGKPMSNTRTLVLGRDDGQLVPVGVWGELYAGGEGVARGYFGRPDLTAERFVPDPFPPTSPTPEAGARLYRTGDRARLLADGTIEFAGRYDNQVKVRGFRIELGEIETALAHLPGVLESTVLVREDSPGVRRITAYVVPQAGADTVSLDPDLLREELGATLPEYMIPTAWVVLAALPLTPNGKIDRRALPAPETESAAAEYVAPRNETEALLAGIWADVLGRERIGVEEDFFDLGGNSLLSLQVAARAGQAGLSFHVREMFEHSTVASLARALGAETAPVEPPIEPVPRDRPLPLSFAQQRLWFLDRLEPGSPLYNIFTGLRLTGRLDVSALERAVTEVVRRHEAVRTVFATGDGEPVQIVMPPPESFPVEVIDLSSSPARARDLVVEEASRPFDLANGPLLRATLLRLAPEEHIALLTMHHIASDGWSMGILVREITTLYAAFLESRPSPLPDLQVQYADFAVWQREWLTGEVLDGEIAFWRERLAGAPPVLELPTDKPRPSTRRNQGAVETRTLPASLLADLDALSRKEGASLFMTTLAAAQTLLFRVTGQDDVVVGSPVANRNRVEIEPLIGFFVNTLVLRTVLDGDPGFREAIGRVREGALSAYAHQDVPFERLVEELRPERSLAHTPIFQVMVLLQNASRDRFSLPGLEAEGLAGEQTTAKFDLLLAFAETPQGLIASLEYDTDLFFPATARRLLGQLETLLTAAVREPDRRIGDLPLLSDLELQQLLVEWNDVAVSWPVEGCLHELIERQVERAPEAVAVTFEDRSLTYAELNGLANRWAWVLRDLGVGPDTLVGVCLERSVEMVVALVSVIKAGGAYVPIDPSYPKDRLTYMLEDARVPVLLTQERLLPELPLADGLRAICLDTSEPPVREGRPESGTTAKSAAYAIYTSGSTGKPKGAVNTHEGIVNRLLWMQSAYGLGPGDHVLQKTPFSFDVSVWEFFWPLMMGARLVVAKPGGHQDPAYLARLIQDEGITTLHFVPSMLQVFLEEPAVSGCTSLRRVMASGEALPVELEERFFERMPTPAGIVELHNLYGPTEAAVDVTYEPCIPNRGASSVPIGRPVANTRIHLLDRGMRLVPMGVAGELHIGGIQLARGYLRRPELTAERFVPDPCSTEPGSRLYKTGDLARHLPDGRVEYLGRLDFQVKIRGFRIELGEIEAALNRHPAVRESIVIARDDRGGKRLVAYVVPAKGEELSVPALRESLATGLPEHMVPSAFVVLEALPLSPNGKVERKALPAPDEAGSGEWIAPRTPTEELLAAVWAEILGRDRVGSADNFFELGGHSLLATQVVSRVRKVFGVELPLRALFARPTLAGLAREIETGAAGEASLPPIVPVPWEGGRPLSFAQQRLWFLDRLEPGNAVYNLPIAFRLIGRLDVPALASAVSGVVRRHEALRTRFEVVAGEPAQVVDPPAPVAVPVIDLSGIASESEARRLASIDASRPFDLARGPLLRVTLVRLAEEDHLVLATMHHIVSDGWSMGVFIREVAALYVAASAGRPSPLPELPVQYSDFAVWQRRHLSGEALDRQIDYWRTRLAGAPAAIELPTDRPRPVIRRQLGAQRLWSTSPELLERLEALARRRGVTLFMVLLAAFQTLLRRLGGQADCLVGSPIANRNRAEIEGLIGFFVNALVLRGDLSGSPTFTELLGRTREVALGAYAHQDLPFEKLVEELQPERSLSHTPLFQVVLGLQNAPVSAMELPDLRLEPVNPETGTAKFDLTVLLGAGAQGIAGSFEYDLDLFDPATVEAIMQRYTVLLEGVAENPDRRLSDLPLLTDAERQQLVVDWNDTATAFPGDRTIDALFEEQVAKTPGSTAVVFKDQSLTYAELNAEADRLADRLRQLGVGPEVPVGLCADRSLDLMVGLLAIIKAGGAFVPLDPAYPSERLGYMLESSGAPLVLAQSGTLSALPETAARVLLIEDLRGESVDVRVSSVSPSVSRPCPDNLLYIMYTSGSTGRPKGVAITHRSAIRLVKDTNYARFDADETFLQLVPLSFDPSMFEIWGALLYGAKLVLFPARVPLPEDLEETIRTQGVTTLWLTTGLFHQVIDHKVEALAPLRQLLAGGEALSLPHVNKVVEAFPDLRLVNGYGPTEVTCFTTCWQAHPLRPDAPCVPIGKPIANTRVLVLDADGQPVPRGVSGELYAGGVAVARCYFGRPDLTAERFVPDPCPPPGEEGARLYRTGDRVRFLPDGTLEFFGRFDNQVKVRGFRIELGEIETALSRHPGVQEATVLVREDSPGYRRIVAYVVPREGTALDMAALKSFAGGALPDYMVPGAWVFLDALPLTPNGKVDRRALPAPGDEAVGATGEDYVAPRTPVEEILAGLWAEVLGAERIGVQDDFFERGGHSLLATRLISGVRTALGVDLPMRKLFEAPTVEEFALEVEEARRADLGLGVPPIEPRMGQESDLPLSFAQERLWFLDQLESDGISDAAQAAYNLSIPVRLLGDLDAGALRLALGELVRRHESLRTTFPSIGGRPVQRIGKPFDVPFSEIDLSGQPESELRKRLEEETTRPFDLATGPLVRAALLRVAGEEHVFALTQHHIVTDGWSMGVLIRELAAIYGAYASGKPSPLPDPALQYADFSVWQRQWLQGEALDRQLDFWKNQLSGELPVLELPTSRPRPAVQTFRGESEFRLLPSELSEGVLKLGRREGATLFMTLLAAFGALLHRLSGQDDVLVGTPIAGRNRAEVESMLGFFVNTLVLRSDLSGNPAFRELLARVREAAFGAYAHQDLPFEKLVAEVQPDRDLSRTPLFQVFFNVLNFTRERFEMPKLAMEGIEAPPPPSKFDLTLYVSERPDGIGLLLLYNADLFDAERMAGFLAQLEGMLSAFVAEPETPIDEVSLVTEAARAVLPDPSVAILEQPGLVPVHELFAIRAVTAPGRIAVRDGDEIWTYGQLDAQANRLAHRLLAAGLQKGEVVAIDARRSAMLPLSVLGILKAGGAFLILDPAYPASRRAAYLRLAEPRVLIGTEPLPEECEAELASCRRIDLSNLDEGDASAPTVTVGPHDLAYVAFTSGSTGTPKGILGEHAPLSHFLGWHAETFGFGPDDRFSLLSGLAHDPLLRDLFTPLTVGATLCIPSGEIYEDPRSLVGWLAAERVSVMHLTPALAQMLAHGATAETTLPDLRRAFFGGDRLTGRDIAGLQALAPNVRCFNFYGATETPQAMGWHAVTAEETEAGAQVLPVGLGIDGVQLLVLNRRDLQAGFAELGEIAVRTPYLSRGYLGDEALTSRRFPANPFTGDPVDRVYRTGDLGRYREDGQVEFAGRADAQVKIRGFRIELAEVETAVARHPDVAAVAVLAIEEEGERGLAAYVVPRQESLASPALRAFLADRLPAYMVPSAFVFLDRLPLTPNGKLDRRALARLAAPRETLAEVGRVLPRTPIEEMLAELWTDLLRIEGLSVHDSFFDLGGHSLLATQMVSRVREAFGVELPLRRLFETPTVAGLAAAVEAARLGDQRAVAPPIVPRTSTSETPLSFSQERLWILDQLEPGNASYNMPAALRLRGSLDVEALTASFTEIVRRHEVLRTLFASRGGRPVQVIQEAAPFDLPVTAVESEEEARRIAAAETAKPFDLINGPLLRASLLRLGEDDHLLVACMHHIVSDGWSMGVFVAEIAALYGAFAAHRPSPLPPLPVQYADFAEWQRAWLSGEVLEGQIAYWRERLAGAPALLELPTDRPRPPVQTFNGQRRAFLLPAELSEGLLALTRRTGTTPFMLLLAAFEVLLHRYTGADEVVVGTPIAGRTRREIEGLIGFFVNTLVLRDGLGDEPAFTDQLARVKEGALGAFAHQDLPFERLVEELRPERHLAYSPLFQVMFTLQNAPLASVDLPGLTLEPVEAVHRSARFDWTLSLSATPRGVGGYLEYNTDLFDGATIERVLGGFETLLGGIVADPGARVSALPLLPEAERRQVLETWNDTPAPAWEGPVHRLFAEQAARTPDAVAVVCRGEALTYGELDRRADRVARLLTSLGAGPDVPVALSMERSLEMVVGLLGIWKAGGAYLPLDPAYPEDRLAFMLEDSGAPILVTHGEVPDRAWNGEVVRLGPGGDLRETSDAVLPGSGPDHLAYVLYTSGSTGRPKGVQVTHRALANFLGAMRREPGLEPEDVMVAVTSLSFDIAGLELWLPLLIGSRVILASREESADGLLLRNLVETSGGTVLQGTPATWRLLIAAGWQGGPEFKALCGGEAFPPALASTLRERAGSVWNLYGPTETTVWSSIAEIEQIAEGTEGAPVSIGRPIDATTIYLVDPNGEPVPVGVAGELRIGGVGLARGYLGRPDLTADRFVPDPFGEAGDRLYRTGDLARWRPDGTLECLGRIDHQVKVRGFRIELGEIEAALGRHPAVAQAAVAVRGEGDARRLVAYVVPRPQAGGTASADLRAHLRGSLPEYMIPGAWMEMASLPLTPNGKVDKKALPAPEAARGEEAYVAPRTPTEELLAGLWAELLGTDRVGARDDFFALGGHSLIATQLVSRLRETFGVELPLRRVFERSTLAALAAEVESASREGSPVPPIVPVPRTGEGLTLSFGQERLWFLDQLQPGTPAYNIATAVRLDGALDVDAFRAALQGVVSRHESLRTTFAVQEGRPVQVVADDLPLEVPLLDLRDVPADDLEETVRLLAREEARQPFDLAAGPLVRAVLLRLRDDAHAALLTVHHIISDGWSMGVMVREIAALYGAFSSGQPSPLPPLSVQYADFARWQRGWLQGEVLEAELGYWRGQLAGAPPLLDLPADRPRPAVQRFRGRQMRRPLSAALSKDLRAFCRGAGATPFMALLAGLETLIHRYTGREDVVVGTPIAGRGRLETEGLIGYFLNSLVLRTRLDGALGFADAVTRTREVTLSAYAHQDLPFEKLVEDLAAERNLSHAPLFQVMLVFQNTPQNSPRERLELPGLTLSPVEIEIGTAKFDVVLRVHESEAGLLLEWIYNRDLFEGSTVARMADHFETLLAGSLADPGRPLRELPLLTAREEQQILEWNATAFPYPQDVCLHELIEAQAGRTPDRVALVYEDESLTYRALNARANRLARRLMRLGVGPDVLVGVCAERSIEMEVALLAVLKAGGAYVPLDPDYPRERLGWMLEDSRMPVLLAQERLLDRLPEHQARILPLDTEAEDGAMEDDANPRSGVAATDLAYAIFTSGSTGRPKGTLNTHRGIVNRLLWMQDEYGLTGDDRVLQKTPYSFDVSVWELFWPLLAGARLVMARPGGHQDPAYLAQNIVTQGITTLHFVPSMLQVFADAPGIERCVSLERVICSGEALPLDLVRRFYSRLNAGLHNLYGPTEAAVDVTYWACERESERGVVPIGRPVANTQIHLLDRDLRPVPVGVPGELYIGGVQLARGYLARPDLTAERFVPDPFSLSPGSRLYRTGDLARYLPEGAVDFLGRIDHQVKIRGFRIELGEIESALALHPAVRETVVVALGTGSTERRLVAYVVPREGESPTVADLRTALGKNLPEYMVPATFVFLKAFPLTPSGKVDRKALPAPERPGASRRELVAPRNELERFLAGLWSAALPGVEPEHVGIHDNFFDLGGNSISGAVFINRLQEKLGEIVHVVVLFDAPTAAGLAAYLMEHYSDAVARLFGSALLEEAERAGEVRLRKDTERVTPERVAELRRIIRPLPPLTKRAAKNPPAVFVLSPPRSGSTLLRVMMAGHPLLFAPPELELLSFDTLADRRDAFPGRNSFWLEGAMRAVMEIEGCGADEAKALIADMEDRGATPQELFLWMQERIRPRLLVDKTPPYAMDLDVLRRAEETFEGARYVHLLRHPRAMIRSFEEAKLDQVVFPYPHSFGRRELAEMIWLVSHQNILRFLEEVPAERQMLLRFEELLQQPEAVLRELCAFLGVDYHPDMAAPYKNKESRMTDGIHAQSRMLGDVKFHTHGKVDPTVAERWKKDLKDHVLGEETADLAEMLGYERPVDAQRPAVVVPVQPRGERPPLFLVHPAGGTVLCYAELARELGGDQPVYALRSLGVEAGETPLTSIEELAEHYVAAILAVDPQGPYYLGGWSFGGFVAYEIARRLTESGRRVALLALLDASASLLADPPRWDEAELLARAFSESLDVTAEELRVLEPDARLAHILALVQERGGAVLGLDQARRYLDVYQANHHALYRYVPGPYAGRVTLFRADATAERFASDGTLGWAGLAAGGVEVHPVPGRHEGMVTQPHVALVAGQIRECVDETLSEEARSAAPAGG